MCTDIRSHYQFVQLSYVTVERTSPPALFYVFVLTLPVCAIQTNTLMTSTPHNQPAPRRFDGPPLTRGACYCSPLKPASFRVSGPFEHLLDYASTYHSLCTPNHSFGVASEVKKLRSVHFLHAFGAFRSHLAHLDHTNTAYADNLTATYFLGLAAACFTA
jgi:hypothetical protein